MKAYCSACNDYEEFQIIQRNDTYPVKGTPIEIEADVGYCIKCGGVIWDDDLEDNNLRRAFDEYRKRNNMLFPKDIVMLREKYDMDQKEFATILGISIKVLKSYENGNIPNKDHHNLLLLVKNPENFEILLEHNKKDIRADAYTKASNALYKILSDMRYHNIFKSC